MFGRPFGNISIIGLGLIGSSLARAIKRQKIARKVIGYNHQDQAITKALELGIIDKGTTDLQEAVNKSDIVIICTPLSTYRQIFKEISPHLKKGTIISDVGSVKQCTINDAKENLTHQQFENFVPAHPIAGSEKTGVEAGYAELFDDKKVFITVDEADEKNKSVKKIVNLWEKAGKSCTTYFIGAQTHDHLYMTYSHLPQFFTYCAAKIIYEKKLVPKEIGDQEKELIKRSLRIAGSSPDMWADILLYNKNNLNEQITNLLDISTNELIGYSTKPRRTMEGNEFLPQTISSPSKATLICIASSVAMAYLGSKPEYINLFAGSGYKDSTSTLLYDYSNIDWNQVETFRQLIMQEVKTIQKTIIENDRTKLISELKKCRESYSNIIKSL
ncbi:prephenate dehydrogenase/arogenate dehydrogenase family protein [Rickettsiales bacterium]|nr:prephenate dehydrogenase/arogenate dehydrogenase family protein [Rickettsiales bacterium]